MERKCKDTGGEGVFSSALTPPVKISGCPGYFLTGAVSEFVLAAFALRVIRLIAC